MTIELKRGIKLFQGEGASSLVRIQACQAWALVCED